MNRQLLGLTGAFIASVAIAVPSATSDVTPNVVTKKAALMGKASSTIARPEQKVSRLIVKLRKPLASEVASPMSAGRVQALSRTAGASMKSIRSMAGDASLLALDAPVPLSEAQAIAARLEKDPSIEYAVPDIMFKKLAVPNEVRFNEWQWNLFAPGSNYTGALTGGGTKSAPSTGGANLPLAWDVTTGVASVVVAIVDTGIVNHPDLNNSPAGDIYAASGRFLAGYDFISGNVGAGALPTNFVANDGDGRDPDPSDPGDWVTTQEEMDYPSQCDDGQTGPQNSSWHGSHMAGVAAATPNNMVGANPAYGIAGVGWGIRILPVRALGKCGGSLSDIAEAIRWAAGETIGGVMNPSPAQVISLSLGSGTATACDAVIQGAVDAAILRGATVVAATGNDGTTALSTPAKCTGVIAVTAHTINGENADYANVGTGTTISSPGGGSPTGLGAGGPTDDSNWFGFYIWSTILFGNTSPTSLNSAGTNSGPAFSGFTGTSAATPQVSGVAALIKSIVPLASPQFVTSWLSAGGNVRAHPSNGFCVVFAINCGKGLLDARKAVDAATNLIPAVTTDANRVVLPGTSVALTATATAYPVKSITTQVWSQFSGPAVTLSGVAPNVSFTAPASPSTVVLQFRATDSAGRVADDFVSVRSNRPPTLGASPAAQTVTVGQTVSFTVTGTDPDGEQVFFSANAIPQGATFSSAGVFNWDTTGVSPTTTTFTYVATDGISASSQGSVSITVNAVAVAPPGGAPPPTGGGGGGGALPFWQLLLLGALSLAARVRVSNRRR